MTRWLGDLIASLNWIELCQSCSGSCTSRPLGTSTQKIMTRGSSSAECHRGVCLWFCVVTHQRQLSHLESRGKLFRDVLPIIYLYLSPPHHLRRFTPTLSSPVGGASTKNRCCFLSSATPSPVCGPTWA